MSIRPEIPSIRLTRRAKILLGVFVSLILLVALLVGLANVYTEWLWYGEVKAHRVFSTILWTRVTLFVIFGVVLAVVVGANVWLAHRLRPPFRPISQEQQNLERYRLVLEPHKRLLFLALLVVLFVVAGAAAQANWQTWALFLNGQSFGVKDPQFHRDISFFAWDYPAYRSLLNLGFNAIIFSILLVLVTYYLFGALRIATPGPKLTIAARRHITLLVFFFIILKACAYWLDRYGLVFSTRGKVTGAAYADVKASLPALTILFWIAILIALAVLASLWLKSALIATVSFVVLLVLSIGINGLYPTIVEQVSVKPNASVKEAPYISRNIQATRQAYGIVTSTDGGTVGYQDYTVSNSPSTSALAPKDPTVENLRILDPNVVSPNFTNVQRLRNQYGFNDKLDIDRYTIDGKTNDYVIGVRELKATNLTGNQTNWINSHTFYTHGYGVAMAAASSDVTNTKTFDEGGIPPTGKLNLTNPQVYYGELMPDYSIVGAAGDPREYDASDARNTYTGSGGVSLGGIFNRLAFAVKYGQASFVLNDTVSAKGAKIIFDRDPRQRVQKIAPFLAADGDPYPAVVDGHIVWIVDAYTTMSNYPYSERASLATLTADTLTATNRTATQANQNINYIRNSVKATVDAFTGKVTLYSWDPTDPVLKTWMKVFPGLVQPKADMPADVLAHVRYPEDLFEVQRSMIASYHVTDPVQFYNVADKWTVPTDPYAGRNVNQPPYYVLANAPSPDINGAQFQLTTPMKVNNSPNLAAWISVNCDPGADYGKMTVLKAPQNPVTQGPEQIGNYFQSNAVISKDISLLNSGGSQVIHGNLLTVPIGQTFLYVEPLYVQSSDTAVGFPTLQRVLVVYGDKIGYGARLQDALANLDQSQVGASLSQPGTTNPPTTSPPTTSPPTGSVPPQTSAPGGGNIDTTLSQLDQAMKDLQAAYQTGDFAKIGQAQQRVSQLTQQYLRERAAASATAKPTPSTTAKPSSTHS